jgi:beta-lactamase class A
MQEQPREPRPVRHPRRRLALLAVTVALVLVATVVLAAVRSQPAAETPLPRPTVAVSPVAEAPDTLAGTIGSILDDAGEYRIGVALADVSGDAARTFGDTDVFTAASTAKIITAAAYYHLVETGEVGLDDPMGDYDAAFQLEAMVNQSNNDSWLLLMDAVGYPRLIGYAATLGVTYDPEQNLLTPAGMALVLKKLYAGDLLNREHTAELLGYMQDTNNDDLIPAGSRAGIEVHHKYGEIGGELHDAALLTYRGSTFSLVIFTENPDGAEGEDQAGIIRKLTGAIEDELFTLTRAGR